MSIRWAVFGIVISMIIWTSALSRAEEPEKPFDWIKGPTEAKLGDQAVLKLPEGAMSFSVRRRRSDSYN